MMNNGANRLRLHALWHFIGVILVAYIIYVTLTPNPMPMPGRWTDKLYHFAGYFVVTAWYLQFVQQRYCVVVSGIVLGIALECAQLFVETRTFDWADMAVNIVGVIVAMSIIRGALAKVLSVIESRIFLQMSK